MGRNHRHPQASCTRQAAPGRLHPASCTRQAAPAPHPQEGGQGVRVPGGLKGRQGPEATRRLGPGPPWHPRSGLGAGPGAWAPAGEVSKCTTTQTGGQTQAIAWKKTITKKLLFRRCGSGAQVSVGRGDRYPMRSAAISTCAKEGPLGAGHKSNAVCGVLGEGGKGGGRNVTNEKCV